MSKLFISLLISLINLNDVLSDCGTPGNSEKSQVIQSHIKEYYKNGDTIKYQCKYSDSPIIIGPIKRKCENDRWTGSIPKCGKEINDRDVDVYGDTVLQKVKIPTKIAGLTVKILSTTEVRSKQIANLDDSYCTVVTGYNPPENNHYNFTVFTQFTCVTTHVNVNKYSPQSNVSISIDKLLKIKCADTGCEDSGVAQMDSCQIYRIDRDDCDIPDVPSNGEVKRVEDDTQKKFIIQCKNEYESMGNLSYAYCPLNGDWEYTKFPKCPKMVNEALIIGLSIGIIGIIIIALFIAIYIRKKRKTKNISENLKVQNEYNSEQTPLDDHYEHVYYEAINYELYNDVNENVDEESQYTPMNSGLDKNDENNTPQTSSYLNIFPNN